MALIDSHGRTINYLRLSVTDRCNLRCSYCMPAEGVQMRRHDDILSYEDLYLAARTAVAVGVEKIRITGGEPLVRKGVTGFLARLAAIPGLRRLVLTTNGILLKEMAAELRDAGVESLNISLDSLIPDTFARITRGGELRRVLEGIEAAERAGFSSIKINCVVMRGVNDSEVADFAALTLDRPYRVRFIEYMPTLQEEGWQSLTVPGEELLARLGERFQILPAEREALAGPATYYRIAGGVGKIGVITPVSCHFCNECNRMRITSMGVAKSCLFAEGAVDLLPLIKKGDEAALREALRQVIAGKPKRHSMSAETTDHAPMAMSQVGG
jgi:cyclic pyranopterin phosphate synthase